jgi:hypothetical protein
MLKTWRVTNAIVARLQADTALRAVMPDGAWFSEAPPGRNKFVIVSQVPPMLHTLVFGGGGFSRGVYLVDARARSAPGSGDTGGVHAAADRLGVLLDGDLTIPGYGIVTMQFEDDLDFVEVDSIDTSIRWNRCGGHLRVMATPA